MSREIEKAKLLGRWRIVEWVQRYDDGRRIYPLGRDPHGFIQYDAERMFCFLSAGERPKLSGSQWAVPESERAAAYSSCLSYSGRWEIQGEDILHHVDLSLNPNWVGTVQRRGARFLDERRIALTARLEADTPEARTAELIWER